MHDTARLRGPFFAQNAQHVRGRFATMNDKGPVRLPRSANVGPKARSLPLEVALAAKVVKSGFADGND